MARARRLLTATAAAACLAMAGCSDIGRTWERSMRLGSPGPQISETTADEQEKVVGYLRRFSPPYSDRPNTPIPAPLLIATRSSAFAYIDTECDAYLDAIFWANRTRNTITRSTALIGSATTAVMAVTGAGPVGIAAAAAAFGLASSLVDSYYETFLYALEPSGVMGLIEDAQSAYTAPENLRAPINEGELLAQVQGYIRQCSPPKIEALVNEAISESDVTVRRDETAPLTPEEAGRLETLTRQGTRSLAESLELAELFGRFTRFGVAAPAADTDMADGAGESLRLPPTGAPGATNPTAFSVPRTTVRN